MENEVRLIDANAVDYENIMCSQSQLHWLNAIIEQQPTIDPESLRPKGRWIIKKRYTASKNPYLDDSYHASAICSECGFCVCADTGRFGYPKLNTTNYCPNCGAKMEG